MCDTKGSVFDKMLPVDDNGHMDRNHMDINYGHMVPVIRESPPQFEIPRNWPICVIIFSHGLFLAVVIPGFPALHSFTLKDLMLIVIDIDIKSIQLFGWVCVG